MGTFLYIFLFSLIDIGLLFSYIWEEKPKRELSGVIRTIDHENNILVIDRVALLAGGCASGTKATIKDIDWGSRIGTYTYEEALAELGEPDVIGQSSEGKIAEWVLQRSPNVSFGFGFGSGSFGRHTSTGVGVGTTVSPPPSGEYLHLRFDNDGKLAEWTKVKY